VKTRRWACFHPRACALGPPRWSAASLGGIAASPNMGSFTAPRAASLPMPPEGWPWETGGGDGIRTHGTGLGPRCFGVSPGRLPTRVSSRVHSANESDREHLRGLSHPHSRRRNHSDFATGASPVYSTGIVGGSKSDGIEIMKVSWSPCRMTFFAARIGKGIFAFRQ
jgi:hypothetical protein